MQTRPSDRGAHAGNVERRLQAAPCARATCTGAESAGVFPLVEIDVPPPDVRSIALVTLGCMLAGGGLGLLVSRIVAVPFALALGLTAFAVAFLRDRARRRRVEAEAAQAARVFFDDEELWCVESSGARVLLRIDRPFGATLFATPERDRLVLALTHRDGVEYLAGRAPSGQRHEAILARTITTARSELPIAPRMPTFDRGDRLLDLVAHLLSRAEGALDRVWLSDAGMCDLVLDGERLRAGELDFDLARPLRWRAFTFQEGSALTAQTYQATVVRQGEREVVLVSLAPAAELASLSILDGLAASTREGPLALDSVQRALARDLRLAQGLVDMPPARAHRVAVDRLFVPRLRAALDVAPTEEHTEPPRASAPTIPSEALVTPPEGTEQLRSSRP
jgi:hypothetical protein